MRCFIFDTKSETYCYRKEERKILVMKLKVFIKILEGYLDVELVSICYKHYNEWKHNAKWKHLNKHIVRLNVDPTLADASIRKLNPINYKFVAHRTSLQWSLFIQFDWSKTPNYIERDCFHIVSRIVNKYLHICVFTDDKPRPSSNNGIYIKKNGMIVIQSNNEIEECWIDDPIIFALQVLRRYIKNESYKSSYHETQNITTDENVM